MQVVRLSNGAVMISLTAEEAAGVEQEALWVADGNPHLADLWQAMNEADK